ncbi:undecaprenyl-phosphate glucose phosphotransferase [Halopseudomonas salegens]|uniref:Putative colanic acid biosysnthesis UDP-glucose lipid carrier transferase n=1 Tax=Halopseudomonas salegens TaxID=1434072 RepID=A0A1H2FL97_9GAMM|nr:undecaprenyl-phosphate glucose phosphotransferase [Halopseudomonas salegens]SDU08095.1 putative colanic acid biosysnthesis UDP-glucose lipid carrier transferase [Halopseudomonas salegens]
MTPINTTPAPGQVRGLTFWGQWLVAQLLSSSLLIGLTLNKLDDVTSPYRILIILAVVFSIPVYSLLQTYHKEHGKLTGLSRLLGAWLVLLASLIITAFVTKTSATYSREIILLWAFFGFLLQAASYLPLQAISNRYHQRLRQERRSLIIGTGELAEQLIKEIQHLQRDKLIGLVQHDDQPADDTRHGLPVLGNLDSLRALIHEKRISRLYIALPLSAATTIEGLYFDLLDASVDVVLIPDLHSLVLLNHSVHNIGSLPALHLNESPLTAHPTAAVSKAIMDRSLALLAIIGFGPLMLLIALLVKLSSQGPILFKQQRHGMNGHIINVYKFRSMRLHDDQNVKQATRDDTRITPIGHWIRRTSMDELPQFFNVLQGQMSLVGPRPHAVAHNNYYTDKIDAYMARHRIKPGITGLAQISGYRGETDTLDKMQKRVELDLEYINNWSIWLDIKILLKTPFTLFNKNIY